MKKRILVLISILTFWQILNYAVLSGSNQLLSPFSLLFSLIEGVKSGQIIIDSLASLFRVSVGFTFAFILATPLALLAASNKVANSLLNPIIEVLRPIPPIAWIPISIIFFGLGNISSYFIVFLGSFFPVFSNTYLGASSLPLMYKRVSETFELSAFDYFSKVLFKFSLPYIFTGLKIGIGMAWMSVIASELVSGQSGLGYYIQINRLLLNLDNVIVGMAFIGFIGYAFNVLFTTLERIFIPWNKNQ